MRTIFKETAWYRLPFIRIALALIAGIIAGRYGTVPLLPVYTIIALAMLVLLGFNRLSVRNKFAGQWVAGLAIQLLFVGMGYWLIQAHQKEAVPINRLPVVATVLEPLTASTGNSTTKRTTASVAEGKIMLYFSGNSSLSSNTTETIGAGTQLLLRKKPQPITATGNPGGFNYKKYAASQQLFYQLYVNPGDYLVYGRQPIARTAQLLAQLKAGVLRILNQYIKGEKEAGVAEALLIGYKKNLSKELLQAYSSTGVVHIIAISGLHLGMIYGLLLLVLKPFEKYRYSKWLKPVILLLVIWIFTLLTGASPSILRAAVMFSFLILGQQMERTASIYNSLAASAFCMLCFNPLLLWDIGFQLSYAAVTSIALFAKPITHLLYLKNKLLRHCWELTAVTLSAQILTLPLLLFYFHQFPNLFLFTNFIAIPLSGLILYLEIVLLVVSPVPIIAALTGKLTGFLLQKMNSIIEDTARIPFAVTNDLQIDLLQTVCLYVCIGAMAYWLMQKKPKALFVSLAGLLCLTGIGTYSTMRAARQQKLLVYYFPKTTAIDLIEGNTYLYLGNPAAYKTPLLVNNYLRPSRTVYRAGTAARTMNRAIQFPLITGRNKTVLIVYPGMALPANSVPPKVDLVIISGNPAIRLSEIARCINSKYYVFDCSNPLWKIERWKKEAENLHLRHHSVPGSGAFEFNL